MIEVNQATKRYGVAGIAIAGLLIGVLHLAAPTSAISPVQRTISEYGLTDLAWVFNLAVLTLALSSAAIFTAVIRARPTRRFSLASVFAGLWSAGLIVIVLFPKSGYSTDGSGSGGEVHRLASFIAFVSLPIAVLILSRRGNAPATPAVPAVSSRPAANNWARWLSIGALAWFLPMIIAMIRQGSTGPAWWTVIPLGLIERGMAVTAMAALVALSLPALRVLGRQTHQEA